LAQRSLPLGSSFGPIPGAAFLILYASCTLEVLRCKYCAGERVSQKFNIVILRCRAVFSGSDRRPCPSSDLGTWPLPLAPDVLFLDPIVVPGCMLASARAKRCITAEYCMHTKLLVSSPPRHMIRLGLSRESTTLLDCIPEICLINAHDGTSAYLMLISDLSTEMRGDAKSSAAVTILCKDGPALNCTRLAKSSGSCARLYARTNPRKSRSLKRRGDELRRSVHRRRGRKQAGCFR
jgi:hypothetical protein